MALKLPRAGGGRGSRRRAAGRSVTSADVPSVSSPADPGVRVSQDNTIGRGLAEAAGALEEGANTALQLVQRDEGLARDADDRNYSKMLQEQLREAQSSGDLSDPAFTQSLSKKMAEERDRLLSEHKGGQTSFRMLKDRLERKHLDFSDTLAALNIDAGNKRLTSSLNKSLNSVSQGLLNDPDVLLSEDPMEPFRRASGQFSQELDFREVPPAMRRAWEDTGNAEIANSIVSQMIQNGQFDRAKDFLDNKDIGEFLSSEVQRDAAQRIVNAEKQIQAASRKGAEIRAMAEAIRPNGSEEEIEEIVNQLAGVKNNPNLEMIPGANGQVYIFDRKTEKLVQTLGPSPEEQARIAAAVERTKFGARVGVINGVFQQLGIPLLPDATGTSTGGIVPPASSGQRTTGTQPLPDTDAGGGQATQTGQATVEGQTQTGQPQQQVIGNPVALQFPLGQDVQASEDLQAVANLLAGSRILSVFGEGQLASNFMAQANFLMDNSPSIRESRELDKKVGMEFAREFQVSPTTTFRQLRQLEAERRGQFVPKTAGQIAAEKESGRRQAKQHSLLGFIGDADTLISDILEFSDPEDPEGDPTLLGLVGGLRGSGQTGLTILDDLGFGHIAEAASDAAMSIAGQAQEEGDFGFDHVVDFFDDPELSSLDIMANSIGLILARIQTPEGRVPVEVIRRSIDAVGLKGLRGSEQIRNRLKFVRDKLLRPRANRIRKGLGLDPPADRFPKVRTEPTGQQIPTDPAIPRFRILRDDDGNPTGVERTTGGEE